MISSMIFEQHKRAALPDALIGLPGLIFTPEFLNFYIALTFIFLLIRIGREFCLNCRFVPLHVSLNMMHKSRGEDYLSISTNFTYQ